MAFYKWHTHTHTQTHTQAESRKGGSGEALRGKLSGTERKSSVLFQKEVENGRRGELVESHWSRPRRRQMMMVP